MSMTQPRPGPARPAHTRPRPGPSPMCLNCFQPRPGPARPGPQYVGPGPARPGPARPGPARGLRAGLGPKARPAQGTNFLTKRYFSTTARRKVHTTKCHHVTTHADTLCYGNSRRNKKPTASLSDSFYVRLHMTYQKVMSSDVFIDRSKI